MGLLSACESAAISLRMAFIYVAAHLVAWMSLARDPATFRRVSASSIAASIPTLIRLQAFRHGRPLLTRFLIAWSYLAEGDTYLIVVPYCFWTSDYTLARYLSFVVIFGLVAGNILKDTFQLPRPMDSRTPNSSQVWTPASVHSADHAALKDFGFPSTHVLNAVSNPGVVLMFLFRTGALSFKDSPLLSAACLLVSLLHVVFMVASRLFIGVHSPLDVKGGLIMGVLTLLVANSHLEQFDTWLQEGYMAPLLFAVVVAAILGMSPQPRPRTPTFLQSAQLLGLALGICIGGRLAASGGLASVLNAGSLVSSLDIPFAAVLLLRAVIGFPIVIAAEMGTKVVLVALMAATTGIDISKPFVDPAASTKTPPSPPSVSKRKVWWPPQGTDITSKSYAKPGDSKALSKRIAAEAFVRTLKYAVTAVAITHGVPVLFGAISL